MLQFATRITGPKGDHARIIVTTTPRPIPLIKALIADPGVAKTKSTTWDNAANLDTAALGSLSRRYGDTRLGRQELEAELLDDVAGALWNRAMLDDCRVKEAPLTRQRVVVAVDPSGNTGEGDKHAECGIIVVARCADGHAYLLSDASAKLSPERWAQRAVDLYYSYRADRIVAEKNFGGQMVESTIRMVNQSAKVQLVQASRGKAIRAEPVACLYEQQRVHHVGVFPQLEEQMCSWTPTQNGPSPDRLNALVWGVSELLVEGSVWT